MPSHRSGSGRDTVSEGRDALPEVRDWAGDPPGYSGVVGRPSRRSESGREALPKVWELSRVPPDGSGVVLKPSCRVGMSSRRSGSGRVAVSEGRDALPEVREWL